MANKNLPFILVVDDNDEAKALKLDLEIRGLAKVQHRHPQNVEPGDLRKAALVLVDYELTHWIDRDRLDPVSLKPINGLALNAILQQHAYQLTGASPTAFAIYTGKMNKLAAPLPPQNREHIIAHMNNLEWVFSKGASRSNSIQMSDLAGAVIALPKSWPSNEQQQMRLLGKLLKISGKKHYTSALLADVATCLPPIRELSEWTHGHAVLRWLLHRILPYPCFLWDTFRLATRFRIDHDDLSNALLPGKPLRKKLNIYEYQGILSDFSGTRWWRASLEQFLWDETKGNSSDIKLVQGLIRKYAKARLKESHPLDYPIVCLDKNYRPGAKFSSVDKSVRIQPDDWPAYAEQAWTTIELATDDPKIRALVIKEDLGKLG